SYCCSCVSRARERQRGLKSGRSEFKSIFGYSLAVQLWAGHISVCLSFLIVKWGLGHSESGDSDEIFVKSVLIIKLAHSRRSTDNYIGIILNKNLTWRSPAIVLKSSQFSYSWFSEIVQPVIVVHGGGAGSISKERSERVRHGVTKAALLGYHILKDGGSAVDAVEGAVVALEDDPEFNAGHGSVLNEDGQIEMDASIMDGKSLNSGAVSSIKSIANPIKVARLVMEKTNHSFLTDRGATCFAKSMGIPIIPCEKLVTERNVKRLKKEKAEKSACMTEADK
uniref:Asparaginase and isoaspartyl peptidase 1 n=1 Tax=Sarcophilus harrisii TaxID=9305 RepID=A0A7N4NGF8_SARHA